MTTPAEIKIVSLLSDQATTVPNLTFTVCTVLTGTLLMARELNACPTTTNTDSCPTSNTRSLVGGTALLSLRLPSSLSLVQSKLKPWTKRNCINVSVTG